MLQVFFLVAVDAHVEMLILSLVGSHPIDSFDKKILSVFVLVAGAFDDFPVH